MWEIEFTQEVKNYFVDNGRHVARLYLVVRDLINTEGIPRAGAHQDGPGELSFEAENHTVYYQRFEERKLIRVEAIKPK